MTDSGRFVVAANSSAPRVPHGLRSHIWYKSALKHILVMCLSTVSEGYASDVWALCLSSGRLRVVHRCFRIFSLVALSTPDVGYLDPKSASNHCPKPLKQSFKKLHAKQPVLNVHSPCTLVLRQIRSSRTRVCSLWLGGFGVDCTLPPPQVFSMEKAKLYGRLASTSTARIYLQDATSLVSHLQLTQGQRVLARCAPKFLQTRLPATSWETWRRESEKCGSISP